MATLEVRRALGTREPFLRRLRHCRGRLALVHLGAVTGEDVDAAEELITERAAVLLRLVGDEVPPQAAAVLEGLFAVRAVVALRLGVPLHYKRVGGGGGRLFGRTLRRRRRRRRRRQGPVGRLNLLHILQLVLLAPKEDAFAEAAEVLVVAIEVDEHRGHEVMRQRRRRRARRRR